MLISRFLRSISAELAKGYLALAILLRFALARRRCLHSAIWQKEMQLTQSCKWRQ